MVTALETLIATNLIGIFGNSPIVLGIFLSVIFIGLILYFNIPLIIMLPVMVLPLLVVIALVPEFAVVAGFALAVLIAGFLYSIMTGDR